MFLPVLWIQADNAFTYQPLEHSVLKIHHAQAGTFNGSLVTNFDDGALSVTKAGNLVTALVGGQISVISSVDGSIIRIFGDRNVSDGCGPGGSVVDALFFGFFAEQSMVH